MEAAQGTAEMGEMMQGGGLAWIIVNTLALGLVGAVVATLLHVAIDKDSNRQGTNPEWWLRSRYSKYKNLVLPPECR